MSIHTEINGTIVCTTPDLTLKDLLSNRLKQVQVVEPTTEVNMVEVLASSCVKENLKNLGITLGVSNVSKVQ